MFNVKIKQFYDTEQIQVFQKCYHSKGEVEKDLNCDHVTGEIWEKKPPGEVMENPFTDSEERFEYFGMDDDEKREESIRTSCSRSKKMIYDISRSNYWDWFLTFTFDPEKVDRFNYLECAKKLSRWLDRLRKRCPGMIYLVVPEKHKSGAFHFHGLFANVSDLEFVESGHFDSSGKMVYNVDKYKFGFTTATRIGDTHKASSYLCKYITKELCAVSMGKKRYWASKNVRRPVVTELLLEGDFDSRISEFMEHADFVKMAESAYGNCIYIDRSIAVDASIYSENMS